jgi:hypothetical protein
MDGDGDNDLAVARQEPRTVSFFKNNGSGTFYPETEVTVHSYYGYDYPMDLIAADFDGDSHCDLAVADLSDSPPGLFLNNGTGSFEWRNLCSPTNEPAMLVASDFDGDLDLDIAVTLVFWNVEVMINQGDAYFTGCTQYDAGYYVNDVVAGDFDGDSDNDIAVANWSSNAVSMLLNAGDGTFAPAASIPAGDYPSSAVAADLDGDEDLDLAVASQYGFPYPSLLRSVYVLLNNGDATFGEPVPYPCGSDLRGIIAADLDGDLDSDLVVVDRISNKIIVLLNSGTGTFQEFALYSTGLCPRAITAADLDGDGDIDVATANSCSDDISVIFLEKGLLQYDCGDTDGNRFVDIDDIIFLITHVFASGPQPQPPESGNADCSGIADIDDIVYLINNVFASGPDPCDSCK